MNKGIEILKELNSRCADVKGICDNCTEDTVALCDELCGACSPRAILHSLNKLKEYENKQFLEEIKDLAKDCDTQQTCVNCKRKAECQEMCGNDTPWIVIENIRRGIR